MSSNPPPSGTQSMVTIGTAVATVILTVLGANGTLEYRATERASGFRNTLTEVERQNHEILLAVKALLEESTEDIEAGANASQSNVKLNKELIERARHNEALNQQIIRRIEALEKRYETK